MSDEKKPLASLKPGDYVCSMDGLVERGMSVLDFRMAAVFAARLAHVLYTDNLYVEKVAAFNSFKDSMRVAAGVPPLAVYVSRHGSPTAGPGADGYGLLCDTEAERQKRRERVHQYAEQLFGRTFRRVLPETAAAQITGGYVPTLPITPVPPGWTPPTGNIKPAPPAATTGQLSVKRYFTVHNQIFKYPDTMITYRLLGEWENVHRRGAYGILFTNCSFIPVPCVTALDETACVNALFRQWDSLTIETLKATDALPKASVAKKVENHFPHTCRCGAPAYVGYSSVDCSAKCGVR